MVDPPLVVAEDLLHSLCDALAERADQVGVLGHQAEAFGGELAPRGAAEVNSRVADLFMAGSACTDGLVLEELHLAPAVRAADVVGVVGRPIAGILTGAFGHEHLFSVGPCHYRSRRAACHSFVAVSYSPLPGASFSLQSVLALLTIRSLTDAGGYRARAWSSASPAAIRSGETC